jgi:NAD+-dependent protein deacetylase SIR2
MQTEMYVRYLFFKLVTDSHLGDERVARDARPVRVGTLRPAIVLYDEPHPLGDDIAAVQTTDLSKRPDLLIIMGTSLKVHGLKKLVKEFAKAVHSGSTNSTATSQPKVIFVNKTAPAAEWSGIIDVHVQGTTDEWVDRVTSDWKQFKPADWETQPTLKEVLSNKNTKTNKATKDPSAKATKPKGEFHNPTFSNILTKKSL